MNSAEVLLQATSASFILLTLALLLTIVRLIRGPGLADRILALDMITMLAVGYIATFAIRTGFSLYLDIAISLSLVGFLSTIALARYLLRQAQTREASEAGGEIQ